MKNTSLHHPHRLMTSAFLCLAILISMATGGCFDQARTVKEQHALILEKAEQDRKALDNLIKLTMRERKAAECRFDKLKAGQDCLTEQVTQSQIAQSELQGQVQSLQNNMAEQFNQAWQEQQRTLTLEQTLLDRVETLTETVQPLPDRSLALERRQERLMLAMENRLNEVLTELRQVRQENQLLAQDNAALTLAVQGMAQDIDLVHKRQSVLVDLIEAKGTGVDTQLGQVNQAVAGVQHRTDQIAQGLQQVTTQQVDLAQSFSEDAETISEQLKGIGQQNGRQLALQRRLHKTMQEAQTALTTLQTASTELQSLLVETQAESQEQFAVLSEQGQGTQIQLSETQEQIHENIESVAVELAEVLEVQGEELTQGIEESQERILCELDTLTQQQTEGTEQLQDSLSQIEGTLAQAEQLLLEQFGQLQIRQDRLTTNLDQTQDRLNDGLNGLYERSSQWSQQLTQLNHRADMLGDQLTDFGQQINTATEALKLQTQALERQQQGSQSRKTLNDSVQQGLGSMGKTLEHVRDLQLALKEQLNQVKRELQRQQVTVAPAASHLSNPPALKKEAPKPPRVVH